MHEANVLARLAQESLVCVIPFTGLAGPARLHDQGVESKQDLFNEHLAVLESGISFALRAAEQTGPPGELAHPAPNNELLCAP